MRAAAAYAHIQAIRSPYDHIAKPAKLIKHLPVIVADAGRQFDHAFRRLGLDMPANFSRRNKTQHFGGGFREVVIVSINELDLELDTERKGP